MAAYRPVMPTRVSVGRFFVKSLRVTGTCVLALPIFAVSTAVLNNPNSVPQFNVVQSEVAKPRDWQMTYATLDPMVTDSILESSFKPLRSANIGSGATASALDISVALHAQRVQIAALRSQQLRELAAKTTLAKAKLTKALKPKIIDLTTEDIDPIQLASIGKNALDAIDAATDKAGPYTPRPVIAPAHLAYARANAKILAEPIKPRRTNKKAIKASKKQLWCLATGIYFEARGESYRGQVAVAQVIVNRTKHKAYPSTICGVVFQGQTKRNRCQFSFACDGIPERIRNQKLWAQANEIAKKVVRGKLYLSEVANSTHYHATYVKPRWARKLKRMTKIGLHIFYRFKRS